MINAETEDIISSEDVLARPRFLRDIVTVPLEDGVLVDGLGRLETIRGSLAQTILPELLGLMDGTRTKSELVDAFPGIPPHYVETVLATLTAWGMIEAPAAESQVTVTNESTISFLRRYIATLGSEREERSALANLSSATVIIIASCSNAHCQVELLASLLTTTGVKRVAVVPVSDLCTTALPKDSLIVALGIANEDPSCSAGMATALSQLGLHWLRVTMGEDGRYADIGPLFGNSTETCYFCFHEVHAAFSDTISPHEVRGLEAQLWMSFIAMEIVNVLAFPESAMRGRSFRRFTLSNYESRLLNYPRLPGCYKCNRPMFWRANAQGRVTDSALIFEDYVGLEVRANPSPSVKSDIAALSRRLSQESKTLPNCRQIPLYRGDLHLPVDAGCALGMGRGRTCECSLEKLAALLALTGGIRSRSEDGVRRWAATAGNLGSVEIYIASRDIAGLEPGFYFYQAHEHSLAAFRKRRAIDICNFMCRILRREERDLPDALILFTGAFHRLALKYGSFAYRLMTLDAGAAISQLHMIARGCQLRSRTVWSTADDLIEQQLNLDPSGEFPTGIVELSQSLPRPRKSRLSIWRPTPSSWRSPREFADMGLREVTETLLRDSRVREHDPHCRPGPVSEDLFKLNFKRSEIRRLPKPEEIHASLGDLINKRASVRVYSDRTVRSSDLATAIQSARTFDIAEWPEEQHRGLALTYHILARGVQGVEPGVYTYHPGTHGLERQRAALSRTETTELLVQSEYATAPLIVWITGNLAIACAREGAIGHRHLLTRAGAAGHRLWMGAIGLGLSGSIFAGLVPGAARRLLGMDGYRVASLFACAIGHKAD